MSTHAKITVTSGPDRGMVYQLTGEMVRLGRSPENDLVLSDAKLGEHHASIVFRDGRYAICAGVAAELEIDGTDVPPERWVWLPEVARIRFGESTSVEFVLNGSGSVPAVNGAGTQSAVGDAKTGAGTGSAGSSVIAKGRSASRSKRSAEPAAPGSDSPARSRKSGDRGQKTRTVARFITDGPGDPLVKLGEDGHLPELTLHETQAGARTHANAPKQTNPVLLIVALSFSFAATLLLLIMDTGSFADSAAEKARARGEVEEFYGREGETLKPYQQHLRLARLAHSRKDFETERTEYRSVLALLRSEVNQQVYRYTGLTGNPENDRRLEKLIGTLLSE